MQVEKYRFILNFGWNASAYLSFGRSFTRSKWILNYPNLEWFLLSMATEILKRVYSPKYFKAVSFEVILHESFVSRIKCTDCKSTYIGETGRNLKTRLTVISGITFLNTID